jgi:hypothetical protein
MSFACKWVAHDQIQPRSMAKCDRHPSPTLCRMTAFMPDHVNGLRRCGSPECQGLVGLHGLDRSFCSSLQRRKAYQRHLPIGNVSLVMQSWESRLPTNGNTDVGSRNGMYVFMGTFVVLRCWPDWRRTSTLDTACSLFLIYDVEPPRSER